MNFDIYERKLLFKHVTRSKVVNVIIFAQTNFKFHYDRKYQPQYFRRDDYILLRFYRDYDIFIFALIKRKYNLQFINSFKILKQIKRLTYLFDIFHD